MAEMYEQRNELYTKKLEKITSLSFTEPVSFRFSRCQSQSVESWRDLYGGVLKHLCQKYSEAIQAALPQGEIGDLKASRKMKSPCWVRRALYAEAGLSTDTIVRRLKDVLVACKMTVADLTITYYIDEDRKKAYEERIEREKFEPKVIQLRWDYTGSYKGAKPVSFRFKNHRTRQVKSWNDLYVQLISYLADDYPKVIRDGVSFGDTRIDIAKAGKKKNAMQHPVRIGHGLFVETFGTSSMLIDRIYSALILCKVDPALAVINFTFKNNEMAYEYLGRTSPAKNVLDSETIANMDSRMIRRMRFLLGKHFEDGYRLESSIDRNRLDSYYAEQYKEPLTIGDEELQNILITIATPISGRIMPKKQATICKLSKDILGLLTETFASGATCVYTSEIQKLYQDELGENGIHDEKGLEELIIMNAGNLYRVQHNRICYGRRKADIELELTTYLKECGTPQSIEDCFSRFWYIPQSVLERTLFSTEGIVSISGRTYYYAACLPIKATDRNLIKDSLRSFFMIRPSMTEIELLDIVLQICPHLLSEISFLSWRGLKDSLGYLFRDVITITNDQIVAK